MNNDAHQPFQRHEFVDVPPPPGAEEDDDDEEEMGEEEEDDEEEEEEVELAEGVFEGGVAEPLEGRPVRRKASQADITLYLECIETIKACPAHPILRPGITVQIGMDKNTKLSAVFNRYVEFCNEHCISETRIERADLEFVHCQLLNENDTAETAALMKNDRIRVRAERSSERQADLQLKVVQQSSDKDFFKKLRLMIPGAQSDRCDDVILDCRGTCKDEYGRVQQVLNTTVRCHSVIVCKRCPWLKHMIIGARREQARHGSVITLPDESTGGFERHSDEEDDNIEVVEIDKFDTGVGGVNVAAQIENDEEELLERSSENMIADTSADEELNVAHTDREDSSIVKNLTWVVIEDHPVEAVKILVEYCYTNRVVCLGMEAFATACRTKPSHREVQSPVPPFPMAGDGKRWPNDGLPTISFEVALSSIILAEEAQMRRLSLMCEVAASQVLNEAQVIDALAMCDIQRKKTGNGLPFLRKAAMELVLKNARNITTQPNFRSGLSEKGCHVIPSLVTGTMEAVEEADRQRKSSLHGHHHHHHHHHYHGQGEKRDWQSISFEYFDIIDHDEFLARERERAKRRFERMSNNDADSLQSMENQDDSDFKRYFVMRVATGLTDRVARNRSLGKMQTRRSKGRRGSH